MTGPIDRVEGRWSVDGWRSGVAYPVEIVDQTAAGYTVRTLTPIPAPVALGDTADGSLEPGVCLTVPVTAIRDRCELCHGIRGGIPGNENRIEDRRVCDHCTSDLFGSRNPVFAAAGA